MKILEEGQNLEKVKQAIATDLAQVVNRVREDATSGNINYLKQLPIINIFPLIALYHTTNTAEKVHFAGGHIEYDFSPNSFKVMSNVDDQSFLKPISHSFAPMRDDKGQRAF